MLLSDEELFETVYFQSLDFVDSHTDEATALSQMSDAQRTVYILSVFDAELQNDGLCQFFVNSSRTLAPYVGECLQTVGAEEHRKLLDAFVADNSIELSHLESYGIKDVSEYAAQRARYDFDSFDDAYVALPSLQEYIVAHIKANIGEF